MNKRVRNILLRLLMLIGLGIFISLSIAAKINRDNEGVAGINVRIDESGGHFFVEREEILVMTRQVLGKNIEELSGSDLEMLEKRLSLIPYIKEVKSFIDNNGKLSVNIKQREPLLRVIPIQGPSFYVDEDGYKFPTKKGYASKVPIVTGFIPESGKVTGKIASGNLNRVYLIAAQVAGDPFWSAQFAQYQLSGNGDVEVIPRLGDHVILLGDETDMPGKLRRLKIFYNEILRNIGWDTYKVINVQFNNQIICQKNKNTAT